MKKIIILALLVTLSVPISAHAATPSSGGTGVLPTPSSTGSGVLPTPSSGGTGVLPTPSSGGTGVLPTPSSVGTTGNTTFFLQNPLSSKFTSVGGLIEGFLEIFTYLVVLLAVVLIIWVGLKFILAQGDTKKMNEAKDWLLYIVIGVAVVIGARIIVGVIINTLDATGTVSPGVIRNARDAIK